MLVITDEAAVLDDPGKCPFDHPAAADHGEAGLLGVALHHLDDDVGPLLGPAHEAAGIAAVGEGAFDEWEAGSRGLEDALGAVAVLDIGGVDLNGEQASVGVGQNVAFASFDLLARVVAFRSPF